jgi:hypothetical protein
MKRGENCTSRADGAIPLQKKDNGVLLNNKVRKELKCV